MLSQQFHFAFVQVCLSVILTATGVIIAALGDFSFDIFGYSLALTSVFFQVISFLFHSICSFYMFFSFIRLELSMLFLWFHPYKIQKTYLCLWSYSVLILVADHVPSVS